jgi:hypothetical protein
MPPPQQSIRELKQALQAARGHFTIAPAASGIEGVDRELARMIIKASLAESIRDIMLLAAILALGTAASAALLPRSVNEQTGSRPKTARR